MRRAPATLFLANLFLLFLVLAGRTVAQNGGSFPPAALSAKTIAIVNDTHTDAVAEGAANALRAWSQFRLIDDPESADVTLRFDKSKDHQGQDSHKTDANGNPTDYSYSMSFSSSIHMKAYLKDADAPFYSTKTDDSKAKAGISCVNDLRNAYRVARTH